MFKSFAKSDVGSSTKLKSSAQRALRANLLENIPGLNDPIHESLLPPTQPQQPASTADIAEKATTERGDEAKVAARPTVLDYIWPKKEEIQSVKCRDYGTLYTLSRIPMFFQTDDGTYYPTLKLLQKFPQLLPKVQVDRGAIKFLLGGANIMCPGLTSAGGYLPDKNLPEDTPVAIFAQGKDHPCAIGITKMTTDDIKSVNKGIGIDNVHYIGDGLWQMTEV